MRKIVIIVAAVGAIAVIWAVVPHGHGRADYRDPVQLAEAMKSAEHGAAASCGKLPTGKYFCTVASTGGTSGNYTVTVAADGSSYQAG